MTLRESRLLPMSPFSDYTLRRYEKNALRSPSGIPPRCELVEEGHTEGSGWMAAICKRVRNHPLPVSSSRAQPRDLSGRPINSRRDTAGKRNTKTSIFIFTLTWITAGQGRFLDFARNDVTRKPPAANVPPFRLYSAMNPPFLSAQKTAATTSLRFFIPTPLFLVPSH